MMMASVWSPAKKLKVESRKGPNWLELPIDLTANILQRLSIVDIVTSACVVCPLWWNIHKDPLMWRSIDMTNLRHNDYDSYLEKICSYAVERSCGFLEEIHIKWFASDHLLKCIADRASHLRRLSLAKCTRYTAKGFREFVEKLPMLEELDISYNHFSKESFEAIGRFCPLLKSLKFDSSYVETFYVAKTMSGLRRIEIFRCWLTDDQLLAILDGCPLLEYLGVHDCCYLELSSSLAKRCREQIKDLVFPSHYRLYR